MYAKEATISITFNIFYTYFLKTLTPYRNNIPFDKSLHTTAVAAAAGCATAVLTTPLDYVKDHMQMDKGLKEANLYTATKTLYQRHGFFPMVRTMPVKMARSAWYFSATTLVMDKLKALPSFMQFEKKDNSPPPENPQSSSSPRRP